MEKISVIIPVYKVEKYLDKCVESVVNQTYRALEIILVDDGSPDNCPEICDAWAQKDERIIVIHKENGGLSDARNTGLRAASGEYVLFLDSDDFYPQENFLEQLQKAVNGQDIICFNYARYTDRLLQPMISYPDTSALDMDSLWLELARRNAYQSSAWSKAVKRTLLLENNIFFETGILSEDIEWSAKVMRAAQTIALAPECIYAYRVRQGSITKTVSPRHVDMQLQIIDRLASDLPKGEDAFSKAYNSYVAFQYSALMINGRLSKPKVTRERIREIKNLSWLLRYDTNRLVRLIHVVYNLLGFELTSWLLLIYFKLFCK